MAAAATYQQSISAAKQVLYASGDSDIT